MFGLRDEIGPEGGSISDMQLLFVCCGGKTLSGIVFIHIFKNGRPKMMRLSLVLVVVLSLCIVGGLCAKGADKPADKELELNLGGGVKMKLALIPAGTFEMGSDVDGLDEGPSRDVNISRAFYMGVNEVTQAQYQAIMGTNPSYFRGAQFPVERVTWHNAAKFCERLSKRTWKTIRLPSEAEWEYACRAGTLTRLSFGDDTSLLGKYAWYKGNCGKQTHSVGQKLPNAWGLYDAYGNVSEWCSDHWDESYIGAPCDGSAVTAENSRRRVLRGGSWHDGASSFSSTYRHYYDPGIIDYCNGFRVVVSLSARR